MFDDGDDVDDDDSDDDDDNDDDVDDGDDDDAIDDDGGSDLLEALISPQLIAAFNTQSLGGMASHLVCRYV